MKKYVIFTLLLACCFFGTTTNAATYYASPTGTGVGTLADPCSFATGYSLIINPGDTLYLRGGQYNLTAKTNLNRIGTAEARICIWAFPGETPIFDFRNEPYGQAGFSFNAGGVYMHIKGWVVRYAGDNGIINNGDNHIIENCTFYGNCDTGLQHKYGGGNLIKNCDSYNNFDYKTGGLTAADFGGNADGFADKQFSNANPNTYDGCRAWNNSDDGWDLFQRVGNVIIKNSICYKNGPATYDLTNHARATTDADWFANFPMTVTNADAGTDYVTLTSYINYGNGNGFKLGGDYTDCDVTVTNCLSVANTVRGYDQNNNYGTMTLYNNTAYRNGRDYGFGNGSGGILIIKNCVSLASISANQLSTQTVTNENNSWNTSGLTCDAADFESIDTTLILSARQADGSLPITTFMHLVDGSDLIDAGIAVSLPFSGTSIDLGCYEKGVVDQFPGSVTTPDNKTQTITEGTAIQDIVFTWGDGATSLNVSGLPAGINSTLDNDAKTLTLSGTPTESGVFNYTVSTVGGTAVPSTVTGKLIINSASAKKIAYVTDITASNDTRIFTSLSENSNFNVTKIDGTLTSIDFSSYDIIVLSELINSTSAGIIQVKAALANKPILMMKVFAYPKTTWNWGGTANDWKTTPSTTAIIVDPINQSNPIFTGLSFTGTSNNELEMVTQTGPNNKGVNSINPTTGTAWMISNGTINTLGTIKGQSTNDICIMEIPIGTTVSGSVVSNKFIQIGISGEAYAYATDNAIKLIENACYYLMGMTVPGKVKQSRLEKISYLQTEDEIIIQTSETISGMKLFNTRGIALKNTENTNRITISGLAKGVYLLRINISDYQTETIKFIK